MLKVYDVYHYVSVDGADWRCVDNAYTIRDEEPANRIIRENATFDEVREYLNKHLLWGMYNGNTFFRNKPTVKISYSDAWSPVEYRHLKTLSYKEVYREWKDVPLKWLMEHASAEQFTQYLKEHGIITCQMNF